FPIALDGQGQTRKDPSTIDVNRAGAARALVASLFCAGQSESFAKQVQETHSRLDGQLDRRSVDRESHRVRATRTAHDEPFSPCSVRVNVSRPGKARGPDSCEFRGDSWPLLTSAVGQRTLTRGGYVDGIAMERDPSASRIAGQNASRRNTQCAM